MHIYTTKQAEAVDDYLRGAGRQVCGVNGAAFDLDVVAAKEADAVDTNAESFWDPHIDAAEYPDRLDCRDVFFEGGAAKIYIGAAEDSHRGVMSGDGNAAHSAAAKDAKGKPLRPPVQRVQFGLGPGQQRLMFHRWWS